MRSLRSKSGQVVVEYTLLLAVGVAVAFLITSVMVSRSLNSPGFLISKWYAIIETIGIDQIDSL